MKKLALTFLLLFVLILNGFSQEKKEEKVNRLIIKTDLLNPTFWMIAANYPSFSIGFEKQINEEHSLQISGLLVADYRLNIVPEYRNYYDNDAKKLRSFWGSYLNYRIESDLEMLSLGINLGSQIEIFKKIYLDIVLGGGYGKKIRDSYNHSNYDFRANIYLGYKF